MRLGVQIPPGTELFTSSIFSSITFHHNKSQSVLNQVPREGDVKFNDNF